RTWSKFVLAAAAARWGGAAADLCRRGGEEAEHRRVLVEVVRAVERPHLAVAVHADDGQARKALDERVEVAVPVAVEMRPAAHAGEEQGERGRRAQSNRRLLDGLAHLALRGERIAHRPEQPLAAIERMRQRDRLVA